MSNSRANARPWAIITGASEGIGAGFAKEIDERKTHDVVLVARTQAKLERVAASLTNIQSRIITMDLSQPGSAKVLMDKTKDLRVALLINNAGIAPGGNHEEIDLATIQRTMALNMTTPTELLSLFLPLIKREHVRLSEERRASNYGLSGIINVSSLSAFMPIPSMALYAATKAYLLSFSESIYQEQRNIGCDVPIVCTLPGATDSEIWTKEGAYKKGVLTPMGSIEHVVAATMRALDGNRPLIIPGYLNNVAAFSTRLGPRSLIRSISRRFMGQDPALRDPAEVQETMAKLKQARLQSS